MARIESHCLLSIGFSSWIKNISKIRQSNLFWHFLKILKLCAMSSGSISCCSLRWFPITDPLCSSTLENDLGEVETSWFFIANRFLKCKVVLGWWKVPLSYELFYSETPLYGNQINMDTSITMDIQLQLSWWKAQTLPKRMYFLSY